MGVKTFVKRLIVAAILAKATDLLTDLITKKRKREKCACPTKAVSTALSNKT